MPSTQLSCPHCGSLLSFGGSAAHAAPTPCLICGHIVDVAAITVKEAPTVAAAAVQRQRAAIAAGPPALRPGVASPQVAPAGGGNTRMLAVGGAVFAGLAILLIAGMSVFLWTAFAPSRAREGNDGTNAPAPGPDLVVELEKPGDPTFTPPAGAEPGLRADEDVADLRKPTTASPKTTPAERTGERAAPPEVPIVPVQIVAGGVPGVDQARIDAAITKGVAYLKQQQAPNGTWAGGPVIGYTALAGLTLLECKVPANDPHVLKAAGYIRKNSANLVATYELSLAILFLDRLGNAKDKAIIQGMALRLLAGQNDAGGWTYASHVHLTPTEMHQLLAFLRSHRPPAPPAKAIHAPGDAGKQALMPDMPGKQALGKPDDDPFQQLADLLKSQALQGSSGTPESLRPAGKDAPPEQGNPKDAKKPNADPPKKGAPDKPAQPVAKKVTPINPKTLPPRVQQLPVVGLNVAKGKVKGPRTRGGDNSNTQFALMGLWAARRHDVPTEYSLKLAKKRFLDSQDKNGGGWGYLTTHPTKDTMTCVGLIGLAMGHGVNADVGKQPAQLADPAIQDGLRALGQFIGTPMPNPPAKMPMPNLYFLWSVERVAVLYDLKTIGGKDWYGWGAQALLPNQQDAGHWVGSRFHGSTEHTDTCFALLFLKRSNLVPDLTENLRLYMVIRDPEAK